MAAARRRATGKSGTELSASRRSQEASLPAVESGNSHAQLVKELWQAAVNLRGSIEPADYKRYVLPIVFLRFLSLRFEKRREELLLLTNDSSSDYYTTNSTVREKI